MRDLVETVIGEILARERAAGARPAPRSSQRAAAYAPAPRPVPDAGRDPKLWRACRDFEALFLQQMLAAMRKTVPQSGLLDGGFASDVQAAMLDQAVAEAAAKRAPLGIAATMYRQLSAQVEPPKAQVSAWPADKHDERGEQTRATVRKGGVQ
ncbi:MAG: rod-binding protein [Mariprofundaceae bacterium]